MSSSEMASSSPEPSFPDKLLRWKVAGFIFSIILTGTGLALFGLGVYCELFRQEYRAVNNFVGTPAVLLICLSCFIVLVALVGLGGLIKSNQAIVKAFFVCTIIVLVLEVMMGIAAYIYRSETITLIQSNMKFAITSYGQQSEDELTMAIDKLQQKFACCGFNTFTDWYSNPLFHCSINTTSSVTTSGTLMCSLPDSCCQDMYAGCGTLARLKYPDIHSLELAMHSLGCRQAFEDWIIHNLDVVGIVCLVLAFPQVFGLFVLYCLTEKYHDSRKLYKVPS